MTFKASSPAPQLVLTHVVGFGPFKELYSQQVLTLNLETSEPRELFVLIKKEGCTYSIEEEPTDSDLILRAEHGTTC